MTHFQDLGDVEKRLIWRRSNNNYFIEEDDRVVILPWWQWRDMKPAARLRFLESAPIGHILHADSKHGSFLVTLADGHRAVHRNDSIIVLPAEDSDPADYTAAFMEALFHIG